MSRQLVTVRTVREIKPIVGADAIDCAVVDGWPVVVKRGEFTAGGQGLFFEIDSWLPASEPRFAFLMKSPITWEGQTGMRLRTVKLRGQVSQGLLLPLHDFPERYADDIAAALGVRKYEPPIPANLAGAVSGPVPSFIRKTDQERVQNLASELEQQLGKVFEVTTKLDGTSMTVFHRDGEYGVCGRNWMFKPENTNTLCTTAASLGLQENLPFLNRNVAIQGELCGPAIQGNKERLSAHRFFVFDIWDIDAQRYLGAEERMQYVYTLGLDHVPVVHKAFELTDTSVDGILALADGPSYNVDTKREGLVFKRADGTMSFKAISNSWLLAHNE